MIRSVALRRCCFEARPLEAHRHCPDTKFDRLSRSQQAIPTRDRGECVRFGIRFWVQAQAVCKQWKLLVESSQFRHEFFSSSWGLKKCLGEPRRPAYYLGAKLSHFVWQHPCGASDSLMALALRYGTDVGTLRRLNNLPLSELSVQSRAKIYIPVQQRSDLEGRFGHFLYDPIACRDFVCVADSETLEGSSLPQTINGPPGRARWSEEERAKKLSRMMAQALHISEQSARFYFDEAQGDLKAAYQKYDEDKQWERDHPFTGKTAMGPSSL
ncbi:hypothetical protein WJX74_002280 [Apatococcus lobatus]|uniref:LysM domain-containing protein n=1 Tax=Apatococcus lobatus TaxID=904363 RepID=A0AAW1S4B6_9CHLO